MDYTLAKIDDTKYEIHNLRNFSLYKTLECGQVFRYRPLIGHCTDTNSRYVVCSSDKAVDIHQYNDYITLKLVNPTDDIDYWISYFGFDDDTSDVFKAVYEVNNEWLTQAVKSAYGIRILHQDPFETLISFIISQRNNIPRIKHSIEVLCNMMVTEEDDAVYDDANMSLYKFPTAKQIVDGMNVNEGFGYRYEYIKAAALEVVEGKLDLESLKADKCSYEHAIWRLKQMYGVGDKVANCVALFGLGHTSAFPVDTWIKDVIIRKFNGTLDTSKLGEYGGLIQQYMFYYAKFCNGLAR